ncbi:MAG TPA: acyl-CoA dehydrogenase [Novosphingobium sp.]|jgi:alkylation response protein AidB-like acyl-CoA dehydrogenase|nr:acyl-CoA dehydrogenase [Novosphingobium sp.]
MDFNYSDNQRMLSDMVDRFLTDKHDLPTRQSLVTDPAADAALWRELAELGLIGAAFPESVGGYGESSADIYVVMERFGRHLVTQPFLYTAVICGRLLIEGLSGDQRDGLIAEVIAGERLLALAACSTHALRSPQDTSFTATKAGNGWTLTGRMPVVMGGDRANTFLVAARTSGELGDRDGVTLFMVDAQAPGLTRRALRTIDLFGAAELVLEGVEVAADAIVGTEGGAVPLIELALDHGVAAVCAEAIGSMEYLIPTTAEYTRTRIQYGAPLAKFQVLQHRMADMYIQTQTAKSIAMVAAMSLDGDPVERQRLVSAAKAQVGRSAKFVGYQSVQLHGGMGVSEELDIGHHYIRLNVINQLLGDGSFHLRRFGTLAAAA